MIELFAGEVSVHYGFMSLSSDHDDADDPPGLTEMRAGQQNGLCGAAVPGMLSLITGLHTGDVPVVVRWHETEPGLDARWEDVVEVSFRPTAEDLVLAAFEDHHELRLPAVADLRARYCATGMDAASDAHRGQGEPVIDRYLLELWPSPTAEDAIVRQGSAHAAYWHQRARATSRPAGQTGSDVVEEDPGHEAWLLRRFGGRSPNARLRAAAEHAFLADLDLDLTFALAQADDDTHRRVAAWAALRALEVAQLIHVPELGPSIVALRRGEPAVAPFADDLSWYRALRTPISAEQVPALPGREREPGESLPKRQWNAIAAVVATAEADSLTAALAAIDVAATSLGGDLYSDFISDLRQKFPQLRAGPARPPDQGA
ncbi:hypothetical protein [Actinoplanes sp. NPDC049265]|uniref:hypothetical protein n=1 Tax=Actinoplanes sp. NPDC049265 TaxID=3363902 RepID=UPI0037203909